VNWVLDAAGARAWRQVGDLQLPRTHAYQRAHQGGRVSASSALGPAAHDGQAARGCDRAAAPPPSVHPGSGPLASRRRARAHRVLRCADQPASARRVPHPSRSSLAPRASAPRPARTDGVATDAPTRCTMAPRTRIVHPWPEQRFDGRTRGKSPVR
jgi:hypothetical protein